MTPDLRYVYNVALRAHLNCGECTNKMGKNCVYAPVCGEWDPHKSRKPSRQCIRSEASVASQQRGILRRSSRAARKEMASPTSGPAPAFNTASQLNGHRTQEMRRIARDGIDSCAMLYVVVFRVNRPFYTSSGRRQYVAVNSPVTRLFFMPRGSLLRSSALGARCSLLTRGSLRPSCSCRTGSACPAAPCWCGLRGLNGDASMQGFH